jgi:hypothetical protein
MKKLLLFAGLAAATLSFVGCNKQEADYAGNDGKFTIRFVTPETKTTNDGLSTKWAEGDALTVFYAKAGTTDYSENNKFEFSSPEDGVANADIALASGSYDWYAFYPYNQYFTTPANNNDNPARTYIGSRSDRAQTQAGYDSKAHIAGSNVPVYGVVKGVSSSNDPVIQMKHIASVAEIVVTNKSGKAVTITGIDLSAPEGVDIVGQYNISFDADPVITPYNTYQSNTAKLTVNGGTAFANGASAKFYLVVKPFQAKDLTVKVTTDAGSQEKSVSLSSAASFQAGHIKTLNVPLSKVEQEGSKTVSEILAMSDGESVTTNEVLVVAKASVGILVKEGSDYLYVYDKDKTAVDPVKVGDKVVIEGTTGSYKGAKQIVTPTITVKSSNNTVKHPTAKDITDSFDTYEATYGEVVSYTGALSVNADKGYYNITVEGASARVGSIVAPASKDADAINALDGKNVKVTGYYLYITGKYFYVIATEVKEAEGGQQEGNKITVSMTDYVSANKCTVSSGSDVTMYKTLQLNESVRMSTTGEDNCGSFWGAESQEWRLYQNKKGNVAITVANGCQLVSVKLTYKVSNTGTLLDANGNTVVSGSVNEVSGTNVTYTVGNTGEATNGQVKITEVEVVYTGNGTTFPTTPDPGTTETETKISLPYNASVYVGETYSLNATANVDATIAYESEDVTIATVNANGVVTGVAEGTVKVYARITGVSGQYTSDEKYCNVTVLKKTQEEDGTVVFDQAFLAANKNGSKDVISYTNSSDYGSTSVTELRIYKGKDFVVSASGNHKITSIKITCPEEGTTKQGPGCFGTGAPEGYSYEGKIGTWTGSETSVSFNATDNQVRIIELVVTYE